MHCDTVPVSLSPFTFTAGEVGSEMVARDHMVYNGELELRFYHLKLGCP